MTEADPSAENVVVSLLDNIFKNVGQNLVEPGLQAHEDNQDCDAEAPESWSDITLTDNQSQPIAWTEPKRGRKIQTTSLLLRRKKKEKRRHIRECVLRLRGGGEDDEEDDGINSDDQEDNDDGMKSEQDKGKPDHPSTTAGEKASCMVGDGKEEMSGTENDQATGEFKEADCETGEDKEATKEADIGKEVMNEAEAGKNAMTGTENDKATGNPNESNCVSGDEKDSLGQEGRTSKRQRKEHQKYKDDAWLTEFNDTCGDVILEDEDSFDDKSWSPQKKRRKVYGGTSESDDEDGETPKKKRKKYSQKTLPPGCKPLSPVIQGMLEKLAICKADHSKKKQALNKLAASLAIHRWARKTNFPLLQQVLLLKHFREILIDYGRVGAGVLSTTEASLKKSWQLHYCSEDTKLHKECFLCNEETWGDFQKDSNLSLEPVLDFENALEDEMAEVDVQQSERGDNDAPPARLPSILNENMDDPAQHLDPCPSVGNNSQDLPLSPDTVLKMISTLRSQEQEIEQLKVALDKFQQQDLSEERENGSKGMSMQNESVISSAVGGTREGETTEIKCNLCEATYKNYSTLVKHCKKKHNMEEGKPAKLGEYKCNECGKSYKEKQVLEQHKKFVHNKPTCRFCGKQQSNLKRHEPKCESKKQSSRKKKKCENCGSEVVNLGLHLESCLKRKLKTPPIPTSSLTQQGKFGPLLTKHEEQAETDRLKNVEKMVQEMEVASVKIASRVGISLRLGIRTMANGQCLFECTSAQLLHRRPQDGDESVPLVFQSVVDELAMEGCKEEFEQLIRVKVVEFLFDNDLAFERFEHTGAQGEALPLGQRREAYEAQLIELRNKNQYAMGAGDLMIDGICAVLGVNILIMRTNTPNRHPFDLHTPAALGGEPRHKSPIFLMYSVAGSHFEEARPLDSASEANLLVVQETFLKHNYWPVQYETDEDPTSDNEGHIRSLNNSGNRSAEPSSKNLTSDNECTLPLKTPRKRKLFSMKENQLPLEFSPNEEADGICSEPTAADQEEDRSTSQSSQQVGEGKKKKHKQDQDFMEILTSKEKENFRELTENLNQAVKDLPAFQEELKKVRMGDEKVEKMVREYKDEQDGNDMRGELHNKKFARKEPNTVNLWLAQLRSKVFPYLHTKYPGIDLSILVDFKEEMEHTNYHRADPPKTRKLHKFTLADMKESLNSSYNSLPNPGPSKHQLVMAWQALCRTIAWHAKHSKVFFADRNDAIDTISHYEEAANMIAGSIKTFKGFASSKRAEDQLQGKVGYESHEIAQGVQKWYKSDERERLRVMLDELSQQSDKVVTQSQYVQLQELLHTEMIVSSPFRNIVWRDFPYRGLAEGWQNPGWDPNFISGRPEESIETITEDGIPVKITTDITRPPPSLACEHQSTDSNCTCPDACPPSGYNVLLTWDKGSSQPSKRNRYLHLPKPLFDTMSKFASIRDRYLSSVLKNGPSGEEPENWYMGLCPLLLNSAGKQDKQFPMTMASRIMEMDVTPHMFRRHFCTFLAHHHMEAVRTAQPHTCGHSTTVFQQFYDLNARRDAQALIQTIQNWNSVGDNSSQTDDQAKECQRRVDMEKDRIKEVNKEVEKQEEPFDSHSFKNPILKTDLTLLLKTAIRMKLDVITSHPGYDDASRVILGDQRMSREIWKRLFLKLALQDSPNGELLRKVMLQIFTGRPEPTKHKWSLRESMMERQANARRKGKVDEQLKDPLWILLDTIFTSITSKLRIASKSASPKDLEKCLCANLPSSFNCIHCDQPVCDRCSRYETNETCCAPILKHVSVINDNIINHRYIPDLPVPRQHANGDERCKA